MPEARLVPMGERVFAALLAGDLDGAGRACGVRLPPFFLEEGWLWEIRLRQVRADPAAAAWVVRAALVPPDGDVVGHAGFHGPPDEHGVVEVAYTVLPGLRGRGYAGVLLRALIEEAAGCPSVRVVRAAVSPDNAASLAVVRRAGFAHVGEQHDDVDGLELLFERSAEEA